MSSVTMNVHFRFFTLALMAAFVLTSLFAQAQTSSAASAVLNPIARKVIRFFDHNQVDSLYAMVDDSFKQAISLEKMKTETNRMRGEMGRFKSMKLEKIKNGVAHYKATFDKVTTNFYVGLGKDGKLSTILFRSDQK